MFTASVSKRRSSSSLPRVLSTPSVPRTGDETQVRLGRCCLAPLSCRAFHSREGMDGGHHGAGIRVFWLPGRRALSTGGADIRGDGQRWGLILMPLDETFADRLT